MPVTVVTPEDLSSAIKPLIDEIAKLRAAVIALQEAPAPGPAPGPAPVPSPGPAPVPSPGPSPTPAPEPSDPRILRAPRFAPEGAELVVGAVVRREMGVYAAGRPVQGRRFRNGVDLGDIGGRVDYTIVAADAGQQLRYVETVQLPDGTTFPASSAVVVPIAAVQLQGRAGLPAAE